MEKRRKTSQGLWNLKNNIKVSFLGFTLVSNVRSSVLEMSKNMTTPIGADKTSTTKAFST